MGLQIPEHILQFCPLYQDAQKRFWSNFATLESKILGSMQDLQRAVLFMNTIDVFV
jgi:hypothetical protein